LARRQNGKYEGVLREAAQAPNEKKEREYDATFRHRFADFF
jgi:hypothetical protein